MELVTLSRRSSSWDPTSYPSIGLVRNDWDDYGYQTLFSVVLIPTASGHPIQLGDIKILQRGQRSGETHLPRPRGSRLPSDYCSIGQEFSYYEMLYGLGRDTYEAVLLALRDMVRYPEIEAEFADEPGIPNSLLRFGGAERALVDGRNLFQQKDTAIEFHLEFETSVGGDQFVATLDFGDDNRIPSRVIAVIGYNGCGKTQFLANLAWVAQADSRQRAELANSYGQFRSDPHFSAVVSVSYSAFDTFELPSIERGYVYCGLREREDPEDGTTRRWRLKDSDQLTADFLEALERAKHRARLDRFKAAVEPLSLEPSFSAVDVTALLSVDIETARERFGSLSTGHKIVLNIVTQLVAHLQPNALVLIDEPEAHLHPPLLAALLRSIWKALSAFESFGVVATHSPVVLQEIPRRYVRVLQRYGTRTLISAPEIETFGESVGLLTRHVFSLDASATDHQAVLWELAASYTLAEIEELLGGPLSSQARSLLMGFRD